MAIKKSKAKTLFFIPVADGTAQLVLKQLARQKSDLKLLGEVNLCDYKTKPSFYGLHGTCVAAKFTGVDYDTWNLEYETRNGETSAYPFYDALTYDLFNFFNGHTKDIHDISLLKTIILKGFKGRFANYLFTQDGEIENIKSYLHIIDY